MISGMGNAHSATYAQYSSMISKIDADANGEVTKSEFVNGAPQGVGDDMAASLFDALDTQKTGAVKDSDLANAFAQLSAATQSFLIQAQGESNAQPDGKERGAELFSKLDSDGDGALSRDEFVAGRPPRMSEEQANTLFDKISGENGDSLDQEQFLAGLESLHAGGPQGGGGSGAPKSAEETFDELDTNKDGTVSLSEFLAGRPDNVSEEDATKLFGEIAGESADTGLTKDQFVQGVKDHRPGADETSQDADATDPATLLKQLLAALRESDESSTSTKSGQSLDQFLRAIDAYRNAAMKGIDAAAA